MKKLKKISELNFSSLEKDQMNQILGGYSPTYGMTCTEATSPSEDYPCGDTDVTTSNDDGTNAKTKRLATDCPPLPV
jgi:natural product precursor